MLIPNEPAARNYGTNPYVGDDARGQKPFLYDSFLPDGIGPMERVIAVETKPGFHEAWSLPLLRRRGTIEVAISSSNGRPDKLHAGSTSVLHSLLRRTDRLPGWQLNRRRASRSADTQAACHRHIGRPRP
ncbi:hypothetical protein GWG65_25990 [Bradyrhizobium sp. CSA207]|nr:hypothetical protein [Bradyrhizobium sp. CSA207]